MLATSLLIFAAICLSMGAFALGVRWGRRSAAAWLVRPHTEHTLARMPLPEDNEADQPLVVEGRWLPTNLPGGGSRMERE